MTLPPALLRVLSETERFKLMGEEAANRMVELCDRYDPVLVAGVFAFYVAEKDPACCHAWLDIVEKIFRDREKRR
jgi:hypothetical protein